MNFLPEKAEIFEELQPLQAFRQSQNNMRAAAKNGKQKTSPDSNNSGKGKSQGGSAPVSDSTSKGKRSLPPCLNPECSENHLVKDCQKTSKEQAKRILEEYRAKKKYNSKAPQVVSLADPHKEMPKKVSVGSSINDQSAVVQAELGGWKFACRIDSDADRNAISETIMSFLGDNSVFLPTRLLSSPEKLKAVDGHLVRSIGVTQN